MKIRQANKIVKECFFGGRPCRGTTWERAVGRLGLRVWDQIVAHYGWQDALVKGLEGFADELERIRRIR